MLVQESGEGEARDFVGVVVAMLAVELVAAVHRVRVRVVEPELVCRRGLKRRIARVCLER